MKMLQVLARLPLMQMEFPALWSPWKKRVRGLKPWAPPRVRLVNGESKPIKRCAGNDLSHILHALSTFNEEMQQTPRIWKMFWNCCILTFLLSCPAMPWMSNWKMDRRLWGGIYVEELYSIWEENSTLHLLLSPPSITFESISPPPQRGREVSY